MKRALCVGLLMLVAMFPASLTARGYSADHHEILSRLQMMAGGGYPESEWRDLMQRLDVLLVEAEAAGDWDGYVEAELIRAKAFETRGRHAQAMALLRSVIDEHRERRIPAMRKVYLELAALHAREGNEDAVTRIMSEFKRSPHFDRETYGFVGGSGPDDPLLVPRPRAGAEDSVTLTAMRVQQSRARHGPGSLFPDFSLTDWNGRPHALRAYRGRVLLIDLWVDTARWQRDLAYHRSIYERYHDRGFDVMGLYIAPREQQGREAAVRNNLPWHAALAPRPLLKELGIFGNVSNYLLDQNGVVIGRDLYGADLDLAVRNALSR